MNIANPFQQAAFGVSPLGMGAGLGGINPFQQAAFGVSPLGIGAGYGGINPIVAQLLNPYAVNPVVSQLGGLGVNPYIGLQTAGLGQVTPFQLQTPGLGPTQTIHPLVAAQLAATNPVVAAQLAATNPSLLPYLAQQSGIGPSPFGIQPQLQYPLSQVSPISQPFGGSQWGSPYGLGVSPFGQQFGVGVGQWGTPFGQQGLGTVHPALLASQVPGIDPITAAMLSQQVSQLAQPQLPIRPLISPLQFDPYQIAAAGPTGAITGQAIDPYSILAQTGLISPMGIHPLQQALRLQAVSPWAVSTVSPFSTGLPLQTIQGGQCVI
jgi:hypothetical protein